MEVVEDEMPHVQQILKDVAMEEVEDIQTYDFDRSDDEMEIYNLADIENMGRRGGVQTLTWHWGSSPCPKLYHISQVILHLT